MNYSIILLSGGLAVDTVDGDMTGFPDAGTEVSQTAPVTTNAFSMFGITAGVLALSVLVGMLLAKLKIKKGINLYED